MKNTILSYFALIFSLFPSKPNANPITTTSVATNQPAAISTPIPTITPSPTNKPLTFEEMNKLYGPCVRLPVLMYHHIQSEKSAKENKQTGLSVYTDIFSKQMEYLSQKGYTTLGPETLINYFNTGSKIPAKSVILTFDDGYEDFYTDAYPILNKLNFKATMFMPTGLTGNSGYLNWDQITSIANNNIYIANHSWSHKSMNASENMIQQEIMTAHDQLKERGLDQLSVFAYPYGTVSQLSRNFLLSKNYNLAFTTQNGSTLCKKNNLILPRIRIGNKDLKVYGF